MNEFDHGLRPETDSVRTGRGREGRKGGRGGEGGREVKGCIVSVVEQREHSQHQPSRTESVKIPFAQSVLSQSNNLIDL